MLFDKILNLPRKSNQIWNQRQKLANIINISVRGSTSNKNHVRSVQYVEYNNKTKLLVSGDNGVIDIFNFDDFTKKKMAGSSISYTNLIFKVAQNFKYNKY